MDFLNVEPLYAYIRVSQVIPDIIEAIKQLIDKKHAYVTPDGVYFSVPSFPNYGELSGRKVEDISLLESRVEPSPFKKILGTSHCGRVGNRMRLFGGIVRGRRPSWVAH